MSGLARYGLPHEATNWPCLALRDRYFELCWFIFVIPGILTVWWVMLINFDELWSLLIAFQKSFLVKLHPHLHQVGCRGSSVFLRSVEPLLFACGLLAATALSGGPLMEKRDCIHYLIGGIKWYKPFPKLLLSDLLLPTNYGFDSIFLLGLKLILIGVSNIFFPLFSEIILPIDSYFSRWLKHVKTTNQL